MSSPAPDPYVALAELLRDARRDVLATLVRWTGDLGLAEDVVQDAVVTAMETWPRDGVPPNPVAWLRLVARRRAIDVVRRERLRASKESAVAHDVPVEPEVVTESTVDDDLLRLVFTCCHPALSVEAQVALALRTLCGLSVAEVARAMLVSEQAMAKRLTRTRQKIAVARIPYQVPGDHELPDRWAGVLGTVHLLLNEGHTATAGDDLVRQPLVDEAIRLSRLLHRLQPDDPGAIGLLALGLLLDSRRDTRTDDAGDVVLLPDQDRSRWDQAQISEAVSLVGEGLRRSTGHPDRYVVQAAIAACHALAPSWQETDWSAIVSWYDTLLAVDPTSVVRLNRAVAVAERDGAAAGLAEVDAVPGLDAYPLWHATRAVLLRRLGCSAEARAADDIAAGLPLNEPQRRLIGSPER